MRQGTERPPKAKEKKKDRKKIGHQSYYINVNSNKHSGSAKGKVKMNLKRDVAVLKYEGSCPCSGRGRLIYQRGLVSASLGGG